MTNDSLIRSPKMQQTGELWRSTDEPRTISETLEIIDRTVTLGGLLEHLPAIERTVLAKTFGAECGALFKRAIEDMRRRISTDVSRTAKMCGSGFAALSRAIDGGNVAVACANARGVAEQHYRQLVSRDRAWWCARIDRLISACEGGDLSRDLRVARVEETRTDAWKEGKLRKEVCKVVQRSFTAHPDESPIPREIPIMVGDGDPAIMVAATDSPLMSLCASPADARMLLSCPLFALCMPRVLEGIEAALDHATDCESLSSIADRTSAVSPATQRALVRGGGIFLGNHASHVRATDWTIAQVVGGGTKRPVGNLDLWFAVFRAVILETPTLRHLETTFAAVDAQMKRRLTSSICPMSAMGHSDLVHAPVSLSNALWVVAHWPLISARSELLAAPQLDLARLHAPHMSHIHALLGLASLPVFEEARLNTGRACAMLAMLKWCKRDVVDMRATILALTTKAVRACGRWIPLEGTFEDIEPPQVVLRDHPSLLRILSNDLRGRVAVLLDIAWDLEPSMMHEDVALNFLTVGQADLMQRAWEEKARRDVLCFPEQGREEHQRPRFHAEISPLTCRPLTFVRGTFWEDVAENIFSERPWLCTAREYGRFVCKHNRYPTSDEFLVHLFHTFSKPGKRWENWRRMVLMPRRTAFAVQETMQQFAAISTSMSPEQFSRTFRASVSVRIRCQMDGSHCC